MRKPENFNTGATIRKSDPLAEAIKSNFSIEEKYPVIKDNPTTVVSEQLPVKKETSEIQQLVVEKEKKEKFLVSMAKGERSKYKAFCAMRGISMNHFIMCAVDYFKEDLESGKVVITQHSYKRQ